ncbi:hypothetical protein IFM89_024314, partial [Coptis chinensis]
EIQLYKFAFAEFDNISSRYKQITNLTGGASSRTSGLSVCLSSTDGQVVVGGPLTAASPIQIVAASFSFDTTKNKCADEKLEASLNKSPPQVAGRPSMIGLNFRPAPNSSGRISVRKIDNHQNFVGSFMLQPRGMDVTSPHSTDWRGGLGSRGMKSSIVGRIGSGKTTLKQIVLCLVEPTATRQILLIKGVKKEVPKVGNYKTEIIKESWNDLPAEVLELVISSLFLGDCIRFCLTCKSLISITPQMLSNPPLTQCESRCQCIPWLMSLQKNNSSECIFYYPIYDKCATCLKTAYPLKKVSAKVIIHIHLNELCVSFYLAFGLWTIFDNIMDLISSFAFTISSLNNRISKELNCFIMLLFLALRKSFALLCLRKGIVSNGYKPVPRGSSQTVEIETDRENVASLANALYTTITIPMTKCCFIYSFLYCTYPRGRARARM